MGHRAGGAATGGNCSSGAASCDGFSSHYCGGHGACSVVQPAAVTNRTQHDMDLEPGHAGVLLLLMGSGYVRRGIVG
jgi:hypothetical protein